MNKKLYLIIYFVLFLVFAFNCSQNEIVSPEDTTGYQQDEKMPLIPEPTGPHPIDIQISESVPFDTSDISLSNDLVVKYTLIDTMTGSIDTIKTPISRDTLKVYLTQIRFWKNLASRLIGPGTSYSLSYTSTVGTETYQAWEFSATIGYEVSWKTGFDIEIFSNEVNFKLSMEFTNTFKSSKTFTSEKSVTETQQVEAKEGVNRVYTVWQLMEGYELVDENGTKLTPENLKDYIHLETGKTLDKVLNLPTLIQGTTSIAQSTFDFPI